MSTDRIASEQPLPSEQGVRALPPSEDRATHEQSPQAVSAVPVGIPSADKVLLTHAGPTDGAFEIGLADGEENGVLHMLAEGLANMLQLDSDKPLNCIQMRCFARESGTNLSLTLQRHPGKTPLELKAEVVKLLEQTLAAIETGRHEPLEIMRDTIRNWLEDDLTAQAIEARRAETRSGSVEDESAVAKPCAQPTEDQP